MVDLSRIGRNIGAENLAGALGNVTEVKKKADSQTRVSPNAGLKLENMPEQPQQINIEQAEAAEGTDATKILDRIDYELGDIQTMIRDVIAKKIQLADKNKERSHELLLSAFNDCKNAYVKLKEVRQELV